MHKGPGEAPCGAPRPTHTRIAIRDPDLNHVDPNLRTEQLANPFRPGNGVAPPFLAGRDLAARVLRGVPRRPSTPSELGPHRPPWDRQDRAAAEFAARAERARWVTCCAGLGERHRDDARPGATQEDAAALRRRLSPLAAVGQAIEEGVRYLRPRRLSVGELGYEPTYDEGASDEAADRMRAALVELDGALQGTDRAGALLLYDEAHLLADDRSRERYPLSSLLAALGHVQRAEPLVRVVLCGLPTLGLNLKRARTYAERMFRHVVVGNFEQGDAVAALSLPLAASGRSFERR